MRELAHAWTRRSTSGGRWLVALAMVTAASVGGPAEAAPLTVTYTMTVDLVFGADDLGLDGASLALTGWFDTADTYAFLCCAGPGAEQIDAAADRLVIAGASVPSTNGSYTEVDGGLGFFPNFDGQVFDRNGDTANYDVDVHGSSLVLASLVAALVNGPAIGDAIDPAHFGTTVRTLDVPGLPPFNWLVISPQETVGLYEVTTLGFRAKTVSEPATLVLLGVGLTLLGLGLRRRR